MISQDTAQKVFDIARNGGADFAETYVERWRKRSIRLVNAEAEANSGIEFGCGVRLFYGHDVVYAYTNDLSERSLSELTRTLVQLRGAPQAMPDAAGRGGLDFRRESASGIHAPDKAIDTETKAYKLERLRELDAAARRDPRIQQVEGILDEWEQDVLIANSDGGWVTDRRVRSRIRALVLARDASNVQRGFFQRGHCVGLEIFDLHPPEKVGQEAARQALTLLDAKKAPAGTMPVVIGNGFGGVIFHEALGHLLETTAVAKKASVLSDKLGEKVASDCVTYIDDGTLPHGWGSSEFDDEGAATQNTVLINEGVLESYMVDKLGALKTGYSPTGSGRRQDYTFAPTSRMRNTYISPGNTPKEALFEGIEYGLYAKDMGGGQVSPGTGEYNFAVKEGYIIRNGRIEESVRGAMLVGKGAETIQKIEAVSADLEHGSGMCGSLSGSLPVALGQPHLLVSELVVGGEDA